MTARARWRGPEACSHRPHPAPARYHTQDRVVTYATSKLPALSVFSVLNDPDPVQAIATVRQTPDELVQAHGPFPSIMVGAEPGGTPMPRFGWQTRLDASG